MLPFLIFSLYISLGASQCQKALEQIKTPSFRCTDAWCDSQCDDGAVARCIEFCYATSDACDVLLPRFYRITSNLDGGASGHIEHLLYGSFGGNNGMGPSTPFSVQTGQPSLQVTFTASQCVTMKRFCVTTRRVSDIVLTVKDPDDNTVHTASYTAPCGGFTETCEAGLTVTDALTFTFTFTKCEEPGNMIVKRLAAENCSF